MKRILFLISITLTLQNAKCQSIILECGQNTGNNFNGWYISPYSVFDEIEFDAHSTSFFSEYGGNYAVCLTRKIEEMKSYKMLNLLFTFESINNAIIENVTYYTSVDGKTWSPVNRSRNNNSIYVSNDSLDITHVKAVANATFYNNGKIACNYAKIEGDFKDEANLTLQKIEEADLEQEFFIFSFEHTLNIETAIERPYEILITSITGQIVYREELEGSSRIDLPSDMSGIFIVSIIQDNAFQASKRIAM